MLYVTILFRASLLLLVVCGGAALAQAQTAQRTFVSTLGNDSNTNANCSRVAPCRGFAAAISVVASGGEVVALDTGGYGAVTVTKPVQIISPSGVYAGITAASGDGITINAPNETVVLRGLSINRQGAGQNGVLVQAVGALHVEGCTISGFADDGIDMSVAGKLFVKDSILRNNLRGILVGALSGMIEASLDRVRLEGNGQNGLRVTDRTKVSIRDSIAADNGTEGIRVSPSISDATVALHIENFLSTNNGADGIGIFAFGIGVAGIDVGIAHSAFVKNAGSGIRVSGDDSTAIAVTVDDSRVINNGDGIVAEFSGINVRVSNTTITRNNIGVSPSFGAAIRSFGDNNLAGNRTSDGAFTAVTTKQ